MGQTASEGAMAIKGVNKKMGNKSHISSTQRTRVVPEYNLTQSDFSRTTRNQIFWLLKFVHAVF